MAEEVQIGGAAGEVTAAPRRGDPDYLSQYFQQLVGLYRTMPRPPPPPAGTVVQELVAAQLAAVAEANGIIARSERGYIAWADIYRLEQAMLKLASLPELRRKAWSLRRDFSEIAGQDRYAAYLAANPPDAASAPEEDLRADLEQVLQEIHWLYTVLPVQEQVRTLLVRRTVAVTAWVFGVLLLVVLVQLALEGRDVRLQPITLVVAAGSFGGLISTIRRIQTTPLDENVVRGLLGMSRSMWSVYLSPPFGAVFAIVLLLLFKANLLSGELFPQFCAAFDGAGAVPTTQPATCPTIMPTFRETLAYLRPVDTADYAKLVVWAFIAGFAEQLVPDALSRIASRVPEGSSTPAKVT